ncbi:MAG: hypothetical protein V1702_02005 [Candidatus Woesearchaeota archaeon]
MAKVDNFGEFLNLKSNEKEILLKALGYGRNEHGFVINDLTKRIVWCRYTNEPVRFEEASILPGSTIIIKTTPLSLSGYIEEFLEDV